MVKQCKHCGRSTATAPEPVDWNGHTFCSEACLLNEQQSRGLSAKGTRKPPSMKGLFQRIADLPKPLKIVVWLKGL